MSDSLTGLSAFSIAFIASLVLTVPVRAFAVRVGMVDLPGPRKVHAAPIPLLGGVAIYAGMLPVFAMLMSRAEARAQLGGILGGATLVAAVGFLDDRGWLHHQIKLFVAMPAAAGILLAGGVRAQVFSIVVGGQAGNWLDGVLTVGWVVGITAAFSILDHMDGICAGTVAVASFFFAVLAYVNGQAWVSALAAGVLGAAAGFLLWNFKPAKIFMGDGGAMFLGFLMATLGLKLRLQQADPATRWLVPFLILIVPVFDTTLITISRLRRGLVPFATPGKDHAAHRLANLGLGQRGAVLSLYGLGAAGGVTAILVRRAGSPAAEITTAAGAILVLAAVALLERAPFERQRKASGD
ncbi:MAG TPA: MraY family glycosyltransferase [Methylomirabilota bacterium]|nr:MraY family glycosyltransferase [Methylomirabilota bacterium]